MLVVGCTERGLAGRGVLVVVMMGRGRGRAPRDLHAAAQGVAAAALQAAVGELVAALLPGARSPLGGLGKALIDHTPGPLVDVTVALVEDKDKPLLRGGLLAGLGAAGVAAGLASHARGRGGRAGGAGVLLGAGALGALAGASRPAAAAAPTVMANAAGAAAGALALHLQSPSLPSGPPWRPGRTIRQVAGVLALAAAAELAAAALLQRRLRLGVALPAPSRPLPPSPRPPRLAVGSGSGGGLVVVGMNGAPLTPAHGWPARLLVAGIYGYNANTKWLTELELTTAAAVGDYWTVRGWPSRPARVWPGSRIDTPTDRACLPQGVATVAGVAWAPPGGVCGVRVQVDG